MNTKFKALQIKRQYIADKYVVGIDPGKARHQASILDKNGILLGKSFTFSNSLRSYHSFLQKVKMQTQDVNDENIVFAIETSCNLWITLTYFLRNLGYEVLLVSPLTTKHSRPMINHDFSRTDPKDAFLMASNAQRGYFDFYKEYSDEVKGMHALSIAYDKLRKNLVQQRNRIHALLDRCFPEFLIEFPLDTKTATYLLGNYFLPAHFIALDIETESETIRKLSWGKRGRSHLEAVQKYARESIGISLDANEEMAERMALNSWLGMQAVIEKQMNAIMKRLIELAKETPYLKVITSLKGISERQAALFIAETRDLSSFTHYKQLEKYAGFSLRQSQSGNYVGPRHMNHIGNRRLSCILYKMSEETIKYIPEVRVKFLKRQLSKRSYRKNVVAAASNLLKLIMALVKENRIYEARGNQSVEHLIFLEKKYATLKQSDKVRFAKKVA
jgi:transposase